MVRTARRRHRLFLGALPIAVFAVMLLALWSSSPALAAPRQVLSGSMSWGIKASFRSYITGPIATGSIAVGGGATQTGDGFIFPVASGTYDNAGTTTVAFNGSVHFTGHAGQLDMTISNLRVQMSASSKILIADIVSKAMTTNATQSYPNTQFATLTGGNASEGVTTATWTALPASLTAAGVTPFAGFYTAGTALDPVTINLNLAGTGSVVPTPMPGQVLPTATFTTGIIGASPTPYTYVYGSGATTTTPSYDSTPTPVPGTVATSNPVAGGTGIGTTTTTTTITNSSGTTTTTTTTTGGGGGVAGVAPVAAYAPLYGTLRPPSTGDAGLAR